MHAILYDAFTQSSLAKVGYKKFLVGCLKYLVLLLVQFELQ